MNNNLHKIKTIEFYYRKDGKIFKENHFSYNKKGVKLESFRFEEIENNFFNQLDEENNIISTLRYENNEVVERIINGNIVYNVKMKYNEYGISLLSKNDSSYTEYFYSDTGELVNLRIISPKKEIFLDVERFGNFLIYKHQSGEIYKLEEYDFDGNIISEIHQNYIIKKEYNKKGLVVKLNLYSSSYLNK